MTPRRLVVQHLAVALGSCVVLVALFSAFKYQPRPGWFAAVGITAALVSVAVRLAGRRLIQTTWPDRGRVFASHWRSNDSRAQFLATWLQQSLRDPDAFGRRVQPMLAELATARLRGRHGIDLATQPDQARALLGDKAWTLITQTVDRSVPYAEIELAVESIENL